MLKRFFNFYEFAFRFIGYLCVLCQNVEDNLLRMCFLCYFWLNSRFCVVLFGNIVTIVIIRKSNTALCFDVFSQ